MKKMVCPECGFGEFAMIPYIKVFKDSDGGFIHQQGCRDTCLKCSKTFNAKSVEELGKELKEE